MQKSLVRVFNATKCCYYSVKPFPGMIGYLSLSHFYTPAMLD
jgi:hypothetical protein